MRPKFPRFESHRRPALPDLPIISLPVWPTSANCAFYLLSLVDGSSILFLFRMIYCLGVYPRALGRHVDPERSTAPTLRPFGHFVHPSCAPITLSQGKSEKDPLNYLYSTLWGTRHRFSSDVTPRGETRPYLPNWSPETNMTYNCYHKPASSHIELFSWACSRAIASSPGCRWAPDFRSNNT